MKDILLSADGEIKVYSVPDVIGKNLEKICDDFSSEGGYFDETDFIDWLNEYKYPYKKSEFVTNLGLIEDSKDIPEEYKKM